MNIKEKNYMISSVDKDKVVFVVQCMRAAKIRFIALDRILRFNFMYELQDTHHQSDRGEPGSWGSGMAVRQPRRGDTHVKITSLR